MSKKDKKMLTVLFFEISVFMKKLKPSLFVQCESICAEGFIFIFQCLLLSLLIFEIIFSYFLA